MVSGIAIATAASTVLTLWASAKGIETRQRSTFSQTTSCLKYLIDSEKGTISTTNPLFVSGNGSCWSMCAEGGDKSYLHHRAVSISIFFTLPALGSL